MALVEFRVKKQAEQAEQASREAFVVPIKDENFQGAHLENEINGRF
jgi:hypothetical protein